MNGGMNIAKMEIKLSNLKNMEKIMVENLFACEINGLFLFKLLFYENFIILTCKRNLRFF